MKLIYLIKAPCPKCPYTLGQVKFVQNPCPECKTNGYSVYEMIAKGRQQFNEPTKKKRDDS